MSEVKPHAFLSPMQRTNALAAVIAAALAIAGCGGGDDKEQATKTATAATSASQTALPGEQAASPPWNAGTAGLAERLNALGLPALSAEGQVVHIHQHLDVYFDGKHQTVPAGIGIDPAQGFISELHTHDARGVMHVESPTEQTFTLRQFFGVWGVPLSEARAWVDGKPVSGDPGAIQLASHQEIVVAYGSPQPKRVPATYRFAPGE
jgi:hypothetical protein